tara:strand:+ start:1717 stop:2550 length:834 start_codon:yes stop_codon:yes gene_type:complete
MELQTIFSNPDSSLEIKIPLFEGPLDLLLHLIRKKEVPIEEVNLSELTSSYLEYLENLQSINLDLAGEFLEIAAMLILIKSRNLLPKVQLEEEEFEEEDPEEILRRRLIEYQYYKNAAFELSSLDILGRDIFPRPENVELISDNEENNPEYEDLSVSALLVAFERVIKRLPKINRYLVEAETIGVEERVEELIQFFNKHSLSLFDELFENNKPKSWVIITFISILEMVRLNLLTVYQINQFGSIHCKKHNDFDKNVIEWYELQKTNKNENLSMLKAS